MDTLDDYVHEEKPIETHPTLYDMPIKPVVFTSMQPDFRKRIYQHIAFTDDIYKYIADI